MRRCAVLPLLVLALAQPAPAAGPTKTSWAKTEIALVTSRGFMGGEPATFRPEAPLTRAALARLVADLADEPVATAAAPATAATMAELDAALVRALGLADEAAAFAREARDAGLEPPSRFGTEVVARLLGLRTDHPAEQDSLELLPRDPATRAEAAFSTARILRLDGWEVESVREAALSFELDAPTALQKRVLRTSASLIGFPYVWGGTSDSPQAPFGRPAPGGFDCSGFVWRVYKLQAYEGAPRLASTIRGRTTMQMSAEVPKRARIAMEQLEPGDVLFFGARGRRSQAAQVDHTAVYVGHGWFVHASRFGVALAPLSGWYASRFAWARRPLSEMENS